MRVFKLRPRPCVACAAVKDDFLSELHEFERLTCATDPERSPGHKPATDSEWWSWVTGAEPVPQRGNEEVAP